MSIVFMSKEINRMNPFVAHQNWPTTISFDTLHSLLNSSVRYESCDNATKASSALCLPCA